MGFPEQQQEVPGVQSAMDPVPDCGENSYRGSGRLTGKRAVITGGDSGIGRAVAIAFAREGADVLISYLNEDDDAAEVAQHVEDAGRKCVLVAGDLSDPAHCRAVIDRAAAEFGGIDVLVSNAAFQMTHSDLAEISDEEWDYTFRLNVGAYFYLVKAALPHLGPGSSVIGSSSVNSDMPSPTLAPYAATKAAIANFSASLAQLLGEKGIWVNSVAPGPIWTPLIPATMPEEKVANFGDDTPLGRAGQPAELAPVYVMLASDEGSYISGARVAVTGATCPLGPSAVSVSHFVLSRCSTPTAEASSSRAWRRSGLSAPSSSIRSASASAIALSLRWVAFSARVSVFCSSATRRNVIVDVKVLITSAQPSMLGHSQKVGTHASTSTAQTPKNHALDTCSLV